MHRCKFYDEMDIVLGEKSIIKRVAVASTLERHKLSTPQSTSVLFDEEEELENSEKAQKPKKRTRVSIELEKWVLLQQEAAVARKQAKERMRHEERMRRQDEGIMAYQTAMNKLLDKL